MVGTHRNFSVVAYIEGVTVSFPPSCAVERRRGSSKILCEVIDHGLIFSQFRIGSIHRVPGLRGRECKHDKHSQCAAI